jgi:putative heme iron utilization protein
MNDSQLNAETAKTIKPRTPQIEELLAKSKSLILGTVNAEGVPNASYAPFVQIDNKFYILVSFMSVHTRNLRDQKVASVMFIDDESETKQIYARTRLTLHTTCAQIERDTTEWNDVIAKLSKRHGKILDTLVTMDDFIMIELTTTKGSYVNGFGSAYFIDENLQVMQHRNDVAHGSMPAK